MPLEKKQCNDCGAPLGRNAVKCRCGWVAGSEPIAKQVLYCELGQCGNQATMSAMYEGRRTNVCEFCSPQVRASRPVPTAESIEALKKRIWG